MRLVLDEHIDSAVAAELRGRGHDVVAVTEDPALRGLEDDALFTWAIDAGRVLVARNVRHFRPLAEDRQMREEPFPGLIFVSSRRYPERRGSHAALVRDLAAALEEHPEPAALSGLWRWLGSD